MTNEEPQFIKNSRVIILPRFCLRANCGYILRSDPHSTAYMRTDGYCSAKCKRRDKHRQMREIENSLKSEKCKYCNGSGCDKCNGYRGKK